MFPSLEKRNQNYKKMAEENICPIWVGYLLASPLRKILQNPDRIFGKYIKSGMNVIDIGCAMGFFSLPLAKLVGKDGSVICMDVQEKMLEKLEKRVAKAQLDEIIESRLCTSNSLQINDLNGQIDFVLAFAVIHEVGNREQLFSEIYRALRQGGKMLIAEPKGRVSKENLGESIDIAQKIGFEIIAHPPISKSLTVLLQKSRVKKSRSNSLLNVFLF